MKIKDLIYKIEMMGCFIVSYLRLPSTATLLAKFGVCRLGNTEVATSGTGGR